MPRDVLLKIWKRGEKEELDGKTWPTYLHQGIKAKLNSDKPC